MQYVDTQLGIVQCMAKYIQTLRRQHTLDCAVCQHATPTRQDLQGGVALFLQVINTIELL